jgi:plasmid stability protein
MARNIQIRNVPEDIHRALKVRAAQLGMSLSDYLLAEVEIIARQPTIPELMERLATREAVEVKESSVEIVVLQDPEGLQEPLAPGLLERSEDRLLQRTRAGCLGKALERLR